MRKFEMTKKEMYQACIEMATEFERADLVEMLEHEIELLNKKATKKSAKADENGGFAEEVYRVMVENHFSGTCTELLDLADFRTRFKSTSKMSVLVRILVANGRVTREQVGKKVIFSVA